MQDELGFDPLSLREAMLAGSPPDSAAILSGDYDVDAVNRRLGELGVERVEEIRDHVTGQLKDGTSRTGRPWSELLPDANVELTGQTVRVVARSGQDAPPGVAVKALMTRELEGLLGLR